MNTHSVGTQNKFNLQTNKAEKYSLRRIREESRLCGWDVFLSKREFNVVGQCGKGSENTFTVVGTGQ